jgi:hypothetical protein
VPVRRTTTNFVVKYQGTACSGDVFEELLAFREVCRLDSLNILISIVCATGFGFMINQLEAVAVESVFLLFLADVYDLDFGGNGCSLIRHCRPVRVKSA